MEVLAHVLAHLVPAAGTTRGQMLEKLRNAVGLLSTGPKKLERIRSMTEYLRKKQPVLLDGNVGKFSDLIPTHYRFLRHEIISKPALIFDTGARRTNRWNQGASTSTGPSTAISSNKAIKYCIGLPTGSPGRVEQFVKQFLRGVPQDLGALQVNGRHIGFLRRFFLEEPLRAGF